MKLVRDSMKIRVFHGSSRNFVIGPSKITKHALASPSSIQSHRLEQKSFVASLTISVTISSLHSFNASTSAEDQALPSLGSCGEGCTQNPNQNRKQNPKQSHKQNPKQPPAAAELERAGYAAKTFWWACFASANVDTPRTSFQNISKRLQH